MSGVFVGRSSSKLLMPMLIKHWEKVYSDMGMMEKDQIPPYRYAPSLFGPFRIRNQS